MQLPIAHCLNDHDSGRTLSALACYTALTFDPSRIMSQVPIRVTVSRRATFSAAHRLHNPAWDDGRNQEVFGLCSNPHYHGHNYTLVASVKGPIDPATGYVMDMKVLASIIRQEVEEPFDHRNLNLDTDDFRNINPTAENIAVVIWRRLRPHIDGAMGLHVTLYETERNFVEYDGEGA